MARSVGDDIPAAHHEDEPRTGNDPLAWVAPEPRDKRSCFSQDATDAFNFSEEYAEGAPANWMLQIPHRDRRICSTYSGKRFPMYEFAFKEAGMHLPFNDFQTICPRGQAWVSFKQFGKLFRPYLESVRNFKERYFVVKPLTDATIDSLYTLVEEWKHCEQRPEYYAVKPEDLDAQDQLSYEKLSAYVKSFFPTKCVDVNNNLFFDDEGEYLLVNRLINTKAFLECSSNGEAMRILGKV
ncbi:hypothetical protein RYX36_005062 [Vicia faba]